ncbi:hypothetical protein ACFYW6_37805 [Streptomyces sp. NPDC002659]|uniref:hypothetical protein n=1 Tax=Streptomyces sp. NPDC002659 TaxID=3364656 RepID=UPI003687D3AE
MDFTDMTPWQRDGRRPRSGALGQQSDAGSQNTSLVLGEHLGRDGIADSIGSSPTHWITP